ncbi:MAG: metallophosphoesterase family protein [Thermomicrobiales bacterium]
MSKRRPLRVAHLADTHLGYRAHHRLDPETGRNQRAIDVERAYAAAIDDILTREVDLVVHGGDVFHHTRPSWSAMSWFVRQTRRLEAAKLDTLVIAGNHDTPRLRTSGSAFGLLELALPATRFVTGYEMAELLYKDFELLVTAVPHGALTNPNTPIPDPRPGMWNVLVTHGFVPGMVKHRHEPGEEELDALLLDVNFDYIALGHYHLWGPADHNAYYSGSTERTGWSDLRATPGYVIVTLDGELTVEHVPLPARPMELLDPISGAGRTAREVADQTLHAAAGLVKPEAMVRIRLDDVARPLRREVEHILRREGHDVVWSLEVRPPREEIFGSSGERMPEESLPPLTAMFEEFVTEQLAPRHDEGFVAAFRELGGRALEEAIQADHAVSTTEGASP